MALKWIQLRSLRLRMILLASLPVLIALPLMMLVGLLLFNAYTRDMMNLALRGSLAEASAYLDRSAKDAESRIRSLIANERFLGALKAQPRDPGLRNYLASNARAAGLDFLLVVDAEGCVIASDAYDNLGKRLPPALVVDQARLGAATSGLGVFAAEVMHVFSPRFPEMLRVSDLMVPLAFLPEPQGLLLYAAAHFPLDSGSSDTVLVGGVLVNNNTTLIDRIDALVHPPGMRIERGRGSTAIYLGTSLIAESATPGRPQRLGAGAPDAVVDPVLGAGQTWTGRVDAGGVRTHAAFAPLRAADGAIIGLIGASIRGASYRGPLLWFVGSLFALTALVLIAVSLTFLRFGNGLARRLDSIAQHMTAVMQGARNPRIETLSGDEIDALAQRFNAMLDRIEDDEARGRLLRGELSRELTRRRTLFHASRDGLAILNPSGGVIEVNDRCAQMLGYSGQELKGMNVAVWDEACPSRLQSLDARPGGVIYQGQHRRKDGSQYPAEVVLSVARYEGGFYILLSQRDVSARLSAEHELQTHRDHLENLVEVRTRALEQTSMRLNEVFELSPDGFVVFDEKGQVVFVNRAFTRMFGLTQQDLMGKNQAAFTAMIAALCEEDQSFPGMSALLEGAPLQEGRPRQGGNGAPAGADTTTLMVARRHVIALSRHPRRMVELRARVSSSLAHAVVLYTRDITHEFEINRMKSEFLSTAAHELRTPMTTIVGFAELLMRRDFDPETARQLLEKIYSKSHVMIDLINELLDLARIEARRGKDFRFEPLALPEVIGEALDGLPLPPGRQPPRVECAPDLPAITGDRAKLVQVVRNRVSNAYKYSPQGGDVVIRSLTATVEGRALAGFTVEDAGIGMTPAQCERAFDRFWRADLSGNIPGTGLGLSIVKEIVDLHEGSIEVSSEPGRGSVFTVLIPRE